ncbi:MAG TPA: glycoside hydrolase family 104 protein [Scandinavium sp.]|jgi:muramidase (phage lysozyme)
MQISNNMKAYLSMLGWSEGTTTIKGSDNGYNVIVGGGLFTSYADHPHKSVKIPSLGISSTAAGRYQLLAKYWDGKNGYKYSLKLSNYGPESQDAVAVQQIKEQGAYADIESGNIKAAIQKCSNIWASLPGAGYGQHEQKIDDLLAVYRENGGIVA